MRAVPLLVTVGLATAACGDGVFDPSPRTFNQVDYMGRPAIATVFLPSAQKDPYNGSTPGQHRATYKTFVVGFLTTVAGYTAADADALANVLMPDILTIDLDAASGYLNGRRPEDDVVTGSLMLVFGANAALNDDHVDGNDKAYPSTFPYLGTPFVP